MRVLICGSLTRLSAFSSEVVRTCPPCISSVWRFGRNIRYLTKCSKSGPCAFTNLCRQIGNQHRPIQGQKSGQKYFTLPARNLSVCGPFKMVLSSCIIGFIDTIRGRRGISRRPQTHHSNLNRIALYVMLNGRRNCAR